MRAQLTALPNEVIQTILSHLPPLSATALQETCRHFSDIINEPLIWKTYCQLTFRWWGDRNAFASRLADPSFTEWKALFAQRHRSSRATRRAIDTIIAKETGRLDPIKTILQTGYDAKEELLAMFTNASTSPNHLAQRYWSHAALGCLHRLLAVEEWQAVKAAGEHADSIERPLAALDLFILEERPHGDTADMFARLDSYATSVRQTHPGIDALTPREKAITVAAHLLEKGWVGIQDNRHYHSLDHMFLGVSLFSDNRNSVPLISAVTFCYVVRQFGLRAAPCSYPFHVHALVEPPPGVDLDGNPLPESNSGEPAKSTHLYMDPFNQSEPIPLSVLETQLRFIAPNSRPGQTAAYLSAAIPRDLTIRTAHNILAAPSHFEGPPVYPINSHLATFAGLFALVILDPEPTAHPAQLRQHLAMLTQHFLEYCDLDIHLFETHVLPLTSILPDARAYRNLISQLKESDNEERPAKHRSHPRNHGVKYSVGQVFRHRRRNYLAVIYGWDPYCRMQEHWINMNQVDRLPNGRNQPFYNVLVEDESTRYVAEENVVLIEPGNITPALLDAFPIEIGKWFKRFDHESGTFVSNVRDEYPED